MRQVLAKLPFLDAPSKVVLEKKEHVRENHVREMTKKKLLTPI